MINAADLPVWAAVAVAFFVLLGAFLALVGSIGLARLPVFYERIHAPTLGTSWGTGGIVMASIIFFSVTGARFAVYELLIGTFMIVTTPVSLMLLGRAALYRDRTEQNAEVETARNDPPSKTAGTSETA